ncbi:MAG: nucleotidyltransferase domain-containing protein [Candidatus Cloacimonetes bacterium]|nr:nucleotidyltransferase domain-containing protein [Candidatus Cloacimonadota bacterium]
MPEFRKKISKELYELINVDYIHAVWEGGSSATGYLDEYSDLDLAIVCDDDKVEKVFALLEQFLKEKYGIFHKYRIPEPAWHGMSQCFYQIDNCPPYFYLDIAVQKLATEDRFLEKERHGEALIWFDKKGLITEQSVPEAIILQKGKRAYQNVVDSFFIHVIEVRKLIRRDRVVDAIQQFHTGLLRALSVLLNLKHRPAKYDFGLKYGNRDYSKEDYQTMRRLVINRDLKDLERHLDEIEIWFYALAEELKSKWGTK